MRWHRSTRFDRRAVALADRHYSRQKPGTPQFVRPGRCVVLLTAGADALWVSSWQRTEFVKHPWPGAWECALFRNEGGERSSELIREAVAATRWRWPAVPALGFITFVDPARVRTGFDHAGKCFRKAGWEPFASMIEDRKVVLRLPPERMPAPAAPGGGQHELFRRCAA